MSNAKVIFMNRAFGQLGTPEHLQAICRMLSTGTSKEERTAIKATLTIDEKKEVDFVFERMRVLNVSL